MNKFQSHKIISNQEIAAGIFEIIFDSRDIPMSKPGQFMMVHLNKGEMLLPRPISICRHEKNLLMMVYKIVGKGTEYLSTLKPGDSLYMMGPLGNGFDFYGKKKIALVGGGIGIPPLVSIYDAVKGNDVEIHVYLGFKDGHFLTTLFPDAKTFIVTENLSAFNTPPFPNGNVFGKEGNIINLLNDKNETYDEMYACGPRPMLVSLHKFATDKKIPLQISLEERMACGVGVCMGCMVADESNQYQKICCSGPVFYSDKVVLDYA